MILVLSLLLFTVILIIININISWTGDLPFKLIDSFKNQMIKYNHQYFGIPLNKNICKENLEIIPKLIKKGFTVDNELLNNTFICLRRNNEKIDIDFAGKNIDCMACKTKNANCKSCNPMLKYLENMSYINFLGHSYLCPNTDYLIYLYGKNWNIPKKEKFKNLIIKYT